MELYKILLIYVFSVVCSSAQDWPSEGCLKEFDEKECVTNYYCREYVDNAGLNPWQDRPFHGVCPDRYIIYNGNSYEPVRLYYKDNNVGADRTIPVFHSHWSTNVLLLDISNNEYNTCPTLASMPNLAKLNVSRNYLTAAKLSNQNELDKLTEIDFSHNIINTIEVISSEYSYKTLRKLNLSHNYIAVIPDAIFDKFSEIENLDLSHNYIDSLSVLTFEGLRNILDLNLAYNRITDINSSMLRFNKLVKLDLNNNRIEKVKRNDFDKLFQLTELDLSNNLIFSIHKNALDYLGSLNILDLSNNVLDTLDKECFANTTNLQNINLSNNHFRVLQRDLFKGKDISAFSIKGNTLEGSIIKGTFEGFRLVTELDLSNQNITIVDDFAFYGLEKLNIILLNNNNIKSLAKKSFNSLRSLQILDLSNNFITDIEFETGDLISLYSLVFRNNNLTQIKPEYFLGLNMLQFLDLSNNKISQLEPNSFQSLKDLINFQISNNPISGTLRTNTFDGLSQLPNLDISGSLLTMISNSSFQGMIELKDLNISHSKVNELQFNTFSNTGAIEILDLSFNELKNFDVNTTDLINLATLVISNNFIKLIHSNSFKALLRINKVVMSYNNIEMIEDDALVYQKDLRYLDLSFNAALRFKISQLEKFHFLANLVLSGIKTNLTFYGIKKLEISELDMSYSDIHNVTILELKRLKNLDNLVLSFNEIVNVEVGGFSNLTLLRKLDLSHNKIHYIQPGTFKDNVLLNVLNISHNYLTSVSYGIFRGLIYLNTLDMSFNEIDNLESERFYEVRSLSELIVDSNNIKSVNAAEFVGTSLLKLSIGDNPLSCDILINLKKANIPFVVTAIRVDETTDENFEGVTCNKNKPRHPYLPEPKTSGQIGETNKILVNIRDILGNVSTFKRNDEYSSPVRSDSQNNSSVINEIKKSNSEFSKALLPLTNIIYEQNNTNLYLSHIVNENNNTNSLLERMLKVLTAINTVRRSSTIPVLKENVTVENVMPFINKIKEELEDTIAIEKQNILNEIESKISSLKQTKEAPVTTAPNHALLSSETEPKSFMFMEISVGLILVILVVFVLYKFYNSGMFVPRGRSYSTRNLPEAMENSNL